MRNGNELSRAQAKALAELMAALGEWYHRTQNWTVGAVGYSSASLITLERLAARDGLKVGEQTRKHVQRKFDDLTIAMLPDGTPLREVAVRLYRDGWDGSMKDLLAAAKLLAAP